MAAITVQDLNNAKTDVDHIAAIANSTALTATDRLGNTKDTVAGAVYKIGGIINRGAWAGPGTAYASKDIVLQAGTWYICTIAHTSSASFAADAANWRVYQGVTSGDLGASSGSSLVGFQQAGTAAAARTAQDKLRESVSLADFGAVANDTTKRAVNLAAFQNAMRSFKTAGGGNLFIPPGTWHLSCASAIFIPSNVTIMGVRGASILSVNAADLTTSVMAVLDCGNQITGTRAGTVLSTVGAAIGEVDPATVVSNVHIRHIRIVSDFVGPFPSNSYTLRGVRLTFAYDSSINECDFYNLPNTGIVTFGGARQEVRGNVVQECGWNNGFASTRNGISISGWMDHVHPWLSSHSVTVTDNKSHDNYDEGIMFAMVKGLVIANNVMLGNRDRGIEGDSANTLPNVTFGTYNQEIPGDVIIANNYIDGKGAHQATAQHGITVFCGNEARIAIRGNTIRNTVNNGSINGLAIGVEQDDGGVAVVEDNTIENVSPAVNYNAIAVKAARVEVRRNKILSFTGGGNQNGIVASYTTSCVVEGNTIEAGPDRAIVAACGWQAGTYTPSVLRVNGNTALGTRSDGVRLVFPYATTLKLLDVSDNVLFGLNTSAATDKSAITFGGAAATALSITSAFVNGNRVTYAGATRYPITSSNVAPGAIAVMNVNRNDFGVPVMPFGLRPIEALNIAAALYEDGNNFPSERSARNAGVPTSGTWSVGDRVVNSSFTASANPVLEYACVSGGSPGTWAQVRHWVRRGITANRPTLGASDLGVCYQDTTLDADGKPIWWTGTAWVDATGATV